MTDGQTGQSLLYSGSIHTFHFSNSQNQAIYLEILLVLQLNQVFYNGNMGESPRNEVLMIKNKKTPHESILFLHLFFCFKINIWFLGEFVNYLFNWIAGLLTVMWTLEHGDTFRGSSFFPFLVANLRTPLPTFWRVCNYNYGWIACRIEHCKVQQWGMKLYDIVFRLNNLQPQNLFFFNLQDNSLYLMTVNK